MRLIRAFKYWRKYGKYHFRYHLVLRKYYKHEYKSGKFHKKRMKLLEYMEYREKQDLMPTFEAGIWVCPKCSSQSNHTAYHALPNKETRKLIRHKTLPFNARTVHYVCRCGGEECRYELIVGEVK